MTYIDNYSYEEPDMDIDYESDPEVEDAAHGHQYKHACDCGRNVYQSSVDDLYHNWDDDTLHTCHKDMPQPTSDYYVQLHEKDKPKETTMKGNSIKLIQRPESSSINAFIMNVGEYGRVIANDSSFVGDIVLKISTIVVNLSNPDITWDNSWTAPQVQKLNSGDKLEITVGLTTEFGARILSMARGNKIFAIKEVRTVTNWGLKESKDYVEGLLKNDVPF